MKHLYLLILAAFLCSGTVDRSYDVFVDPQPKLSKFYPNPATTIINFELDKTVDNSFILQVYSFIGKKMTEVKLGDAKVVINLSDYQRGLYIYQIKDRTGRIVDSGKFQVVK